MGERLKPLICSILTMCAIAGAQAQTIPSLDALNEVELSRNLLETTETEMGRHALGLVEPIEQLADHLMTLNQFAEADDLLDRAIQITRFHNGLHTPAQIALLTKRIDNLANRQAWDDAREQMEYLFGYYQRIPLELNENLIDNYLVLAEQHMRGASEDSGLERSSHLIRVYQLNWAMITTASRLFGSDSPQLAPYLYRQAQQFYLFKKDFDAGGRERAMPIVGHITGVALAEERDGGGAREHSRTITRRVEAGFTEGWGRTIENNEIRDFFYEEGLILLEQIRDIYEALDPEGRAMSELYVADWHNLFDSGDAAVTGYENAFAALIESGASNDEVNALFNQPRILPLQQFHASMDDAAANLSLSPSQLLLEEWLGTIPTIQSPLSSFDRSEGNSTYALFSFELAADNESSFFYKNRYKRTVGTASEVELVEGFKGIDEGSEKALERLEQLRFRPKMIEGKPVQSSNFLRYEIAIETSRE